MMVPVVYGNPTPELIEMAREDQIALGGPVEKNYTHFCHECQEAYPFI
jgi:hypothetical protein